MYDSIVILLQTKNVLSRFRLSNKPLFETNIRSNHKNNTTYHIFNCKHTKHLIPSSCRRAISHNSRSFLQCFLGNQFDPIATRIRKLALSADLVVRLFLIYQRSSIKINDYWEIDQVKKFHCWLKMKSISSVSTKFPKIQQAHHVYWVAKCQRWLCVRKGMNGKCFIIYGNITPPPRRHYGILSVHIWLCHCCWCCYFCYYSCYYWWCGGVRFRAGGGFSSNNVSSRSISFLSTHIWLFCCFPA